MPRNIRGLITLVALLVPLTGCMKRVWVKPGATSADYKKDSYECEKDMRQSWGGRAPAMKGFFNRCMEARGWELVEGTADATSSS